MAAMHLEGVPGYTMEHDEYSKEEAKINDFWASLVHADQHNYCIMVASQGQGEQDNEFGIISGHAYSVISVHALCMGDETVRLVKVRNPWGHHEWLGDWCDNSELWTDAFREQVGCTIEDDGIFHMTVEDFLTHFRSTSFCVEND